MQKCLHFSILISSLEKWPKVIKIKAKEIEVKKLEINKLKGLSGCVQLDEELKIYSQDEANNCQNTIFRVGKIF